MRLPSSRQCGTEGDGKKMDQAPPIRNPFVHVLKFTPLEKAKVKSGALNGRAYKEKERGATFLSSRVRCSCGCLLNMNATEWKQAVTITSLGTWRGVCGASVSSPANRSYVQYMLLFSVYLVGCLRSSVFWWASVSNAMTWREVQQNITKNTRQSHLLTAH